MKHGYKLLVAGLSVVALAVALALLAPWGQDSLAADGIVYYVDADATTGANDGSSWADAYTDLQLALDEAEIGDEIWVAAGTYKPSVEYGGTGDRYRSFQLMNGVALYGGFDPTVGDIAFEDRDWEANPTILSGDLNGDDGPDFTNNGENSYHVFYHPGGPDLDSTAILDGFTVSGGNANGDYYHDSGGGMDNCGSSPALTNCTFSGNSASVGGGMYNDVSTPVLTNCILWRDTPAEIYNNEPESSPVVTYSNIEGGYDGEGNIDADPLFVDAGAGDLRLQDTSPAIDAGDNGAPGLVGVTTDRDGNPRFVDVLTAPDTGNGEAPIVDMGAYEALPGVISVDEDATGANDGSSWNNAYTTLQPALDAAVAGDQIWVAAGVYRPTQETSPGDPRSATFQLKNGVAIYGGFDPSMGDIAFEDRDWGVNESILSGDLNGDDAPDFENNDENSYHVFYHEEGIDLDSTAILDGFTVSGGNANGDSLHGDGGGIYNYDSSPTLTNCTFTGNSAVQDGGGIYNIFSEPVLIGCTIVGNMAAAGGGMSNYGASPMLTSCNFYSNSAGRGGGMYSTFSSPMLVDCTFEGNSADSGGGMRNWSSTPVLTNCTFSGNNDGGMHNSYSSPVLIGCTFTGNSAAIGGGMHNTDDSSPTLTNCTFTGNSAAQDGGGMANRDSAPTLVNVTFSDNSAYGGGGMYNFFSSPALTNCTFAGNSADYGGGMFNNLSSPPLTNCILWGNSPDQILDWEGWPVITYSDIQGGYRGETNIDADPLFVDPGSGDFHLRPDSPCIDAGNNDAPYLPDFDFEGDDRILDGDGDGDAIVDMGVDEAFWYPVYLPVVLRGH